MTVPAEYSAFIQSAGATPIQATFIRPTLMSGSPAEVTSNLGSRDRRVLELTIGRAKRP